MNHVCPLRDHIKVNSGFQFVKVYFLSYIIFTLNPLSVTFSLEITIISVKYVCRGFTDTHLFLNVCQSTDFYAHDFTTHALLQQI